MAPLSKWRPPETLIDLYIEKDQTHWYWRLSATVSAALIMIGFLIFPASFPNNPPEWLISKGSGIIAGVLIAIGYVSSAILVLVCKSWVFQMDIVFVPCLFSSVLGLIHVIIALYTRHGKQSFLNPSSLAALILSTFFTTTYLTLTLLTFRKIHIVRVRDAMHRHRSDCESYHLLPEDEMQRQQLLRLLERQTTSNTKFQKPSSAEASQSTFRIDLPESLRRMETRLTAPRNVYEGRNERNNNFKERSLSFSPLSPFASTRWASSPYQPVAQENGQSPQLPEIPLSQPKQQTPERNFSPSSQAPPYSPGEVEAPIEKRGEIADLTGEVHPLEREERTRPQYRVVDGPPEGGLLSPDPSLKKVRKGAGGKGDGDVRRQRSTSRESRRAEIELERDSHGNAGRRAELEGVRVSPRIMRVQTDGSWGR
ncbi:MAG: hypothetical protein LQ343_000899 [Gyalolechia ehrenbergii]|nr:MAG: hypothetical protein LQ343_000899 [Gyalolechia ehrenbergii]